MVTPDERAALRVLAEHRDDMTDRNGLPCYARFTGTDDAHEWATGRGFQNEPVEVCVHCGSYRYTNEGRRGAYERAAALAVPALLDALDAAEAEAERLRREWDVEHGLAATILDSATNARAALDRVRALHDAHGYGETCSHCGHPAPCATVRAIEGES